MMLQIIDLENNKLFSEISNEESAAIIGGATPGVATNMLPMFGLLAMLPLAIMFATTGMLGDIGASLGGLNNSTATS